MLRGLKTMTAETNRSSDLVADLRSYTLLWGLPAVAMLAALFLSHPAKTLVWIATLVWMGLACLVNARRCGRTHCYFTGPFFLAMTVPVFLHSYALMPLGPEGWKWLGIVIASGAAGIWFLSERFWATYRTK